MYGGYTYIDLKYKPSEDDFIVLSWIDGKENLEKSAEAVASESSVGSWTKLKTMNKYVWTHLRARIFKIKKITPKKGFVWIAYPLEHFDKDNVLQFKASVLGNIFGMKLLNNIYILDIRIPKKFQKYFKGPKFGIEGVRKYIGTNKNRRPHVGTIVKPKVGLSPKEFANVAYDAYIGGVDFVKDDENLVDQKFCRWKNRLEEMLDRIDKVKDETGRKVLYGSNITDRLDRMLERLDILKSYGAKMVMLDVFMLGDSALLDIIKEIKKKGLMIHAHRAGYDIANRGTFGYSFGVMAKFYRLFGVDQLHIGTGVGKMEGNPLIIKYYHDIVEKEKIKEQLYLGKLKQEFLPSIKPVFAVASGGVNAGKVDALLEIHGNEVIVQAGAGVHGHPDGTRAGAKSMREAVEAYMKGINSKKYAKTHKALAKALKIWGYEDPKKIKKEFNKENIKRLKTKVFREGIKAIYV